MKPLARALSVLLCLLLMARASVGAMLSVTGASGYAQPEPDDCPFVSLAAVEGAHVDTTAPADPEQPAPTGATEPVSPLLHHHHLCAHCVMQAALPAPIPLAVPPAEAVPVSASGSFASVVLAELVHPPRAGG